MSLAITTSSLSLSATSPVREQLEASGATGDVRWSLGSGDQLPGGLFLSSDGVISGTADISGTFSVQIVALDLGATPTDPGSSQPTPVEPAVGASLSITLT